MNNPIKKPPHRSVREPELLTAMQRMGLSGTSATSQPRGTQPQSSDDSYYDDYIYEESEPSDTSADFYSDGQDECKVSEAKLGSLPVGRYKVPKGVNSQCQSCSICLTDFSQGELLRSMPCTHRFHNECITTWLREKNSCPLCKTKL